MTTPRYKAIEPIQYKDFIIGIEAMSEVSDEVCALGLDHFEEVEKLYREHPCEPDLGLYSRFEEAGLHVLFTVRSLKDGEMPLVGHLSYFLVHSVHMSGILEAVEDFIYLTPEVRSKGISRALFSFAESALRKLKVSYIKMVSKEPLGAPKAGKFLEAEGFKLIGLQYCKALHEEE